MNRPSNPHFGTEASPWVRRFAHLVPAGARVLDLAAGHGRHSLYFAERGCRVLAVDRDAGALARAAAVPGVTVRVADLEQGDWPLTGERFDAVVVVHYLHRPLLPALVASLEPGGTLIYETFARGNEAYGRPSNPDFLLEPGELLRCAAGLDVVGFEQGRVSQYGTEAVVQRIAAVAAPRWPPPLDAG